MDKFINFSRFMGYLFDDQKQAKQGTTIIRALLEAVNSRAMFTTHSRVMFTSDDRVGVYHFKESFTLLLLITPPFFWRVAGSFPPG